jgi:hypothetical protein
LTLARFCFAFARHTRATSFFSTPFSSSNHSHCTTTHSITHTHQSQSCLDPAVVLEVDVARLPCQLQDQPRALNKQDHPRRQHTLNKETWASNVLRDNNKLVDRHLACLARWLALLRKSQISITNTSGILTIQVVSL